MPRKRASNRSDGEVGWFASLLGAVVLIAGGFSLGLVAGVVSEEPQLVVGHLVGRGEEVSWLPIADPAPVVHDLQDDLQERVDGTTPGASSPEAVGETPPREFPHVDLPAVAAAPKHAPAPRTRSEADRHAGFAIQVGAFADAAAADRVYQKLERKGFEVYLVPASRSGDGRSRVRVGTVGSREDAEALASRLKREEGLPTWVLSEGGS